MDCFNSYSNFLAEIELMKNWTKQRLNNETHSVIDELFVWFHNEATKQMGLTCSLSSQFNFTSQCAHFGTCSPVLNQMVHQNTVPIYSQFGHHFSATNHQAQVGRFSEFGNSFASSSTLRVENQVLSPVIPTETYGDYMENTQFEQSSLNLQTSNDANYRATASSRVNVNDYHPQCPECVGAVDIANQSVVCLEDLEEWNRADKQLPPQTGFELSDYQMNRDFPFKCPQVDCGYSFHLWVDLHEHIKLVHGLYNCIDLNCHFESMTQAEVTQHCSIVHSEVLAKVQDKSPPFKCPVQECGRVMSCKQGLTNHVRTHVNQMDRESFHCKWPNCTMKSKYKRSVITHIRSVHFGLPTTKKEQDFRHIVDYRNPFDYLEVDQSCAL